MSETPNCGWCPLVNVRGGDEDFAPRIVERIEPEQEARQPLPEKHHEVALGPILHLPAATHDAQVNAAKSGASVERTVRC